jgi:hypothetical protein
MSSIAQDVTMVPLLSDILECCNAVTYRQSHSHSVGVWQELRSRRQVELLESPHSHSVGVILVSVLRLSGAKVEAPSGAVGVAS